MGLPRFYVPPQAWAREELVLGGEEAHHCAAVMRRETGDEVVTFDGAGAWARCRVRAGSPKQVMLEVLEQGHDAPPAVRLELLQAIPKGGNMELIIEKAVELGVQAVHPVMTARTVVKVTPAEAERKRLKWRRVALEACKQCGQNWLPEVGLPGAFESVWETLQEQDLRLVAAIQPDAKSIKEAIAEAGAAVKSVLVAIGPEGDFTPAEYALARERGCRPVTLGPIILRVETAAMFCLAVLSHELLQSRERVTFD